MASFAEIKSDFKDLIDRQQLAHGYIFFGFDHQDSGANGLDCRLAFACQLANYLENQKWEAQGRALMDMLIVGSGIDDVRGATKFLWQKPFKSPRKILIVPNAENLTLEAQNAILKISENPPPHGLILMTVKNLDALLPTLHSRFQKIFIKNDAGSAFTSQNTEAEKTVKEFFKSSRKRRVEMIKSVVEDRAFMQDFVGALIAELRRDIIKNWRPIKKLLHRWTLINQLNTNKRLQLEAAVLDTRIDG